MRVLIFEPELAGHHGAYLRHILVALRPLPVQVTVATTQHSLQSEEFRIHLTDVAGGLLFAPLHSRGGVAIGDAGRQAATFARALEQHVPDHVYVPYADGLTQALAIGGMLRQRPIPAGVESEALMFRGGFAYPASPLARAKHAASRVLLSRAPWSILHMLDPLPFQAIQRAGGRLAARTRLMPDPVEPLTAMTFGEARRSLGIPIDGRYIGCAGRMDARKGIDLLLPAFAEARLRDDDRLLLAGAWDAALRAQLDRQYETLLRSGRIVLIERPLTADEMQAAIAAMDVICTPYPRHIGSSSIVIRAAAAGRPVLGSSFGWVGATVARFGLGTVCDVSNRRAFSAALPAALDAAAMFAATAAAQRFVEYHSVENFQAHWTMRLRQRLGLPPSACRPWQGVAESQPAA